MELFENSGMANLFGQHFSAFGGPEATPMNSTCLSGKTILYGTEHAFLRQALPTHDGDVRFTDRSGLPFRRPYSDDPAAGSNPDANIDRVFIRATADVAAPSSTGLEPNFAAALAYLAGPFSGILIALVERSNGFVRFHAWQSILGLGGLGVLSAGTLVFSFLTLLLSPIAFTLMYHISELLAVVWVVVWLICLIKAFGGSRWHMPVAGRYAERLAMRQSS